MKEHDIVSQGVSDEFRTSVSHPLRIDVLTVPGTTGEIGMTICPGKKGASLYGRPWDRDLGIDLEVVRAWRPDVVITLMEVGEFAELGVGNLGSEVERVGMRWLHLPIPDTKAPDAVFHQLWRRRGPEVRDILRRGGPVLLHCRGGLGRTGTLAAQLLVEFGEQPKDAIRAVRRARRGAIETAVQEEFVRGLHPPDPSASG
jgi:Cyclin-dependent kinase inhibitor 3 (CDKN3)